MSMQARRFVLVLTAGGRRTASILQPRFWYPLSSITGKSPSNPFEIDLSSLQTPVSTTEKLTLLDAKCASASQQTLKTILIYCIMVKRDVEALWITGGSVRGRRIVVNVKEAVTIVENETQIKEWGTVLYKEDGINAGDAVGAEQIEQSPILAAKNVGAEVKLKKKQSLSGEKSTARDSSSDASPVNVLLLQGPCSFVRGVWTFCSGDVGRKELWQRLQALADDLKVVVKGHNYDSEKMVLEKILDAREDQVIVLCWNISLTKSPFIVHALELIQSSAIIVSPSNVEHGLLPANVVGVLSGFLGISLCR